MEITTACHWYRAVDTENGVEHVLSVILEVVGAAEVIPLGSGRSGYLEGYQVGPVGVFVHPDRSDMGVMVDVDGAGCEELGWAKLAEVHGSLGLRASRLDLAVDGCGFTPADLRDAWRAGDVRTRVQVPETARADRQWRRSRWLEETDGDMFTMGSRTSSQYARCYNRRGPTRFELELKKRAAALAADQVMLMVGLGGEGVAAWVGSWIRRFVDFVERGSDSNSSRCRLLPFWASFLGACDVARVILGGTGARTAAEVREWFEVQLAPTLAVLSEAFGSSEVMRLVRSGRKRWRARHRAMAATGPARGLVPDAAGFGGA